MKNLCNSLVDNNNLFFIRLSLALSSSCSATFRWRSEEFTQRIIESAFVFFSSWAVLGMMSTSQLWFIFTRRMFPQFTCFALFSWFTVFAFQYFRSPCSIMTLEMYWFVTFITIYSRSTTTQLGNNVATYSTNVTFFATPIIVEAFCCFFLVGGHK